LSFPGGIVKIEYIGKGEGTVFFIFGIGDGEKELRVFPNAICPNCGRYTQARLIMVYRYFHIFFIPVFKFRKRRMVLPGCGCSVYEADAAYAEELKTSERIDFGRLKQTGKKRICRKCLRELAEGFEYCPFCGERQ